MLERFYNILKDKILYGLKKSWKNLILFLQLSRIVFPYILRAVGWYTWNAAFGLAVLFPIVLQKITIATNDEKYSLTGIGKKIKGEGIIIFFCNAVLAAAVVEYVLSKLDFGKMYTVTVMGLLILSSIITCLIFGNIYLLGLDKMKCDVLDQIQLWMGIASFVICVSIKTYLYYYE